MAKDPESPSDIWKTIPDIPPDLSSTHVFPEQETASLAARLTEDEERVPPTSLFAIATPTSSSAGADPSLETIPSFSTRESVRPVDTPTVDTSIVDNPTGELKRPLPILPLYASSPASSSFSASPAARGRLWKPLANPRGTGSAFDAFSAEVRAKKKSDEEIKATVRLLLRDVVHNMSSPSTIDILDSCWNACAVRGIDFPAMCQELIELHPPLYWAILTLSPIVRLLPGGPLAAEPPEDGWPVLDVLTAFELTQQTQQDAAAACMMGDDNALYQYLRRRRAVFGRQSLAHSIALPGTSPMSDHVEVQHLSGDGAGHFQIRCTISNWLKKRRMEKQVGLSWIARGRGWVLTFVFPSGSNGLAAGTCYVSLRLMEGSSATAVNMLLLFGSGTSDELQSSSEVKGDSGGSEGQGIRKAAVAEEQPELAFGAAELKEDQVCGALLRSSFRAGSLSGAASLEYEDSPLISPDGSLHVVGDFVLEYQK